MSAAATSPAATASVSQRQDQNNKKQNLNNNGNGKKSFGPLAHVARFLWRHKVSIIFPTIYASCVYYDWSKTQREKRGEVQESSVIRTTA